MSSHCKCNIWPFVPETKGQFTFRFLRSKRIHEKNIYCHGKKCHLPKFTRLPKTHLSWSKEQKVRFNFQHMFFLSLFSYFVFVDLLSVTSNLTPSSTLFTSMNSFSFNTIFIKTIFIKMFVFWSIFYTFPCSKTTVKEWICAI